MIYAELEQAKKDLSWLANKCSLAQFASNRLSAQQYEHLESRLNEVDDEFILNFFNEIYYDFKLQKPKWTKTLTHKSLPMMALVPDGGIKIIFSLDADGMWSTETQNGTQRYDVFPEGTYFSSLKTKDIQTKYKSAKEMFKAIAWQQKPIIFYAVIASFAINILALGTSLFSMQVYDRVIPTGGISTLIALSSGVFIAILLEMLVKISRSSIMDHASKNMDIEYSHNIFTRFLGIRADQLPHSIGTLSAQLQSYGTVRSFITSATMYLIIDFPFAFFFLAIIIMISGLQIGIVAFIFMIVALIVGTIFRKKIENLSQTSSMASHKKLGLLIETVGGAESVKTSGSGWSVLNKWNELTQEAIRDEIDMRRYTELSTYMAAFFQQLSYISIVAYGAYLVSTTDTLTMGGLIATTILSGRVLSPIGQIPNQLVQWGKTKLAIADLDRIYELKSDNEGIERPLSPEIMQARYSCENIRFEYGEDAPTVLISSLKIQPGEKVAIIGSNGAGKSTFLKLLSGMYIPHEGNVLIDGIDIRHISRNYLTKHIGYLPQSVNLFSGTLRDNLILGLVGINDEKILNVSTKTGLINMINQLPLGLDSMIPESGDNVSGGQKQLIAMTRMLLLSPKVWLLDEPTASMDDNTEQHMLQMLHKEIGDDEILVLVTHKPKLLELVDRIVVMSPQGIVMDGPRNLVLKRLKDNANQTSKKVSL